MDEHRPGLNRRRARRLKNDPAFQQLLTGLGDEVDRLIVRPRASEAARCVEESTIAAYAKTAGLSESALQDILQGRSDVKLSTLYDLAKCKDVTVVIRFEQRNRRAGDQSVAA